MLRFAAYSDPPKPHPKQLQRWRRLRAACWRGELPAEVLDTADREELIYELWLRGWTDVEIAAHTMLSTYTTARIRERLGLVPHPRLKGATA